MARLTLADVPAEAERWLVESCDSGLASTAPAHRALPGTTAVQLWAGWLQG
jgi:hypothetical protein